MNEAEAYRQQQIAQAQGDAARFLSVYKAYREARDVTTQRLYLETMETILRGATKVIIDPGAGGAGSGVVPYLPLPEIQKRTQPASQPAAPAQGARQ